MAKNKQQLEAVRDKIAVLIESESDLGNNKSVMILHERYTVIVKAIKALGGEGASGSRPTAMAIDAIYSHYIDGADLDIRAAAETEVVVDPELDVVLAGSVEDVGAAAGGPFVALVAGGRMPDPVDNLQRALELSRVQHEEEQYERVLACSQQEWMENQGMEVLRDAMHMLIEKNTKDAIKASLAEVRMVDGIVITRRSDASAAAAPLSASLQELEDPLLIGTIDYIELLKSTNNKAALVAVARTPLTHNLAKHNAYLAKEVIGILKECGHKNELHKMVHDKDIIALTSHNPDLYVEVVNSLEYLIGLAETHALE